MKQKLKIMGNKFYFGTTCNYGKTAHLPNSK